MSPVDLQDKLTNSNLGNWSILSIKGSPISWNRSRYSSYIDHSKFEILSEELENGELLADWIVGKDHQYY